MSTSDKTRTLNQLVTFHMDKVHHLLPYHLEQSKTLIQKAAQHRLHLPDFEMRDTLSLKQDSTPNPELNQFIQKISERNWPKITPRERETIEWIRQGLSAKQVADEMGISSKTVNKNLENLLRKFNCRKTIELIRILY